MTDNLSKSHDNVQYTIHLIEHLPAAVIHRSEALNALYQRLQELVGRTCTGRAHWRDKNAEGKTAKLYVLHGTDEACPVHGTPRRGARTRSYIGNKPDKISDALAAIEREIERVALRKDLYKVEATISRVTYEIKTLYRFLNYTVPDPGEDAPPKPFELIAMETE